MTVWGWLRLSGKYQKNRESYRINTPWWDEPNKWRSKIDLAITENVLKKDGGDLTLDPYNGAGKDGPE